LIFLKHFRHYYLRYGISFLLGLIILVSVDWFQLEIPAIIRFIIDGVEDQTIVDINGLWEPLLLIVYIVVGMTIGRFLWRYFFYGTSHRIAADVRQAMFKHLTNLDQSYFVNHKVGGLMAYFTNDINIIRELYGMGLLMLIDGLVLGGFVLYRMIALEPLMTLFAFIPIALMGILVFFIEKKIEEKAKARTESFEAMSDFTQESFSGITVIKAYVREIAESLRFKTKSIDVVNTSIENIKYNVLVNVLIETMITLVILAIIAYGSLLIAFGNLSSGQLTEYISYFFTLLWPVFAIAGFFNLNAQAQASAKRVNILLETKSIIQSPIDVKTNVTLKGKIELKQLSFTYPDGTIPVLNQVSFTIQAGEMVGILGRTGSGKSSLVDLLLHLYDVKAGMLFYDGVDSTELSIKTLRDHISYVPQDNFLFSDTITNNIGFALNQPTEAMVKEAAILADIHDNVSDFKDGYQTLLGERGVTVSGGQKQRLSIARALAKQPTILILDDSVSAVDTKTEESIIRNLRKVRQGKTTLLVAHRISTVKKLDKIIVLDQGMLVGFGTHESLLASNAIYQDMVRLQTLENLVGETKHA
jgi:ATP-binding cassette, subfamily B, multidrug efflux pump